MESLPIAPSCALDETGLRSQYDRYRQAGRGARVTERGPLRLEVELDRGVDTELIEETIATERECCPFYELGWEPERRRLGVSVSRTEYAPTLEAIAFALGLEAPPTLAAAD